MKTLHDQYLEKKEGEGASCAARSTIPIQVLPKEYDSDPGITLVIKSGSIQAATVYMADRGIFAQSAELHPEFSEVQARVRKAYFDAVWKWFTETRIDGIWGTLLFYSVDDDAF